MVQLPSSISEQLVAQQLNNALGQTLSEAELKQCLEKIEFLEPGPGKPFWQSVDARRESSTSMDLLTTKLFNQRSR